MFLEQWLQKVETRVYELGRGLWRPSPEAQLRREMQDVEAEIAEADAAASTCRQEAEQFRAQLAEQQRQITRLVAQVGDCVRTGNEAAAWPFVLELEEVRRGHDEAKGRLPRLEQAAWSHDFRARQLDRRLAELRQQLANLNKPQPRPRSKRSR